MLLSRKKENQEQSLKEHSLCVSQRMASAGKILKLEKLARLAGLIHDQGKSYQRWQTYLINGGDIVYHAPYGVEFVQRVFQNRKGESAELTKQILSILIRGHHGGLRDALTPDGETDSLPTFPYTKEEVQTADENFFEEVVLRQELTFLFDGATKEVECILMKSISLAKGAHSVAKELYDEMMFYMGLVVRFLYAALIDADRLDAMCWEEKKDIPEESRPEWDKMREKLTQYLSTFHAEGLGKLRSKLSEDCAAFDAACGIYRLAVPTGGGKTLSSLRLALNMAAKYDKNRILYVAPFLTILEQNAKQIRKAIGEDEEFEHRGQESSVLEFHSNIIFEEGTLGEQQEKNYDRHTERLDKPIILTSMVQFLNALFSGKSGATRRLTAFSNSVIILDEVQAVPTSSLYLFNLGINFLAEYCHCLVILCTATPPALENIQYPVKLKQEPDIIARNPALQEAFRRTCLRVKLDEKFDSEALAKFAMQKTREERTSLLIVNTKSVAKKTFDIVGKEIDDKCHVFYLSTEISPAHRTEKLDEIKKKLPYERILVISTQLIEAGVDISFQTVIRSMAGLDRIIQAAGRCNRNGEAELGTVYVIDMKDENLSMLPDIARGKKITADMASFYSGDELMTPEVVERYYRQYFLNVARELHYKINGSTALELLGYNATARMEFEENKGKSYPVAQLAQSFQTVGKWYTPIADKTIGVIVPCAESEELLAKLREAGAYKKQAYYRRLQKYSINLYEHKLNRLSAMGGVQYQEETGLWILSEKMYNKDRGLLLRDEESVDDYII